MLTLALACTSTRSPPGVPAEALHLVRTADALKVDADELSWSSFSRDPTAPVDPDLVALLKPQAGRGLWLDLPAETEFWAMRRIVGSAGEAGLGPVWVGVKPTEAFPMSAAPKFAIAGCQAPVPVKGVEPMVTLSLQTGREGAWVVASARFVPITDQHGAAVPTDGLDAGCLVAPDCAAVFTDPALVAACAEGGGPERVELGGANGCFLPIARAVGDEVQWRSQLSGLVRDLGLADRALQVVMPEARSRSDSVLAVVGGFVDAGVAPPAIGMSVLVEGNDGPPVCNATVRDRAALDLAAARWVGSLRTPPTSPEDPSGP